MLPVTHGDKFTRLHVLLYTVILTAVTLMPFVTRMSGALYLAAALVLDAVFLWYAVRIYVAYSDRLAQRTFRYSIVYLTAALRGAAARSLFPRPAVDGRRRRSSALSVPSRDRCCCGAARAAAATGRRRPEFKLTDVTGAGFGKELNLTDHNGKPRTLADFRGKVVMVFFGFTHCPDVCPTTLAEMAQVMKELGPDADKVQVLFVTVDPERDTPQVLKQYVPSFNPGVSRALRRRGGDRARGEGIQGVLPEAAGQGRRLQRGPLRGHFHPRPRGQAAPLRASTGRARTAMLHDIRLLLALPEAQ